MERPKFSRTAVLLVAIAIIGIYLHFSGKLNQETAAVLVLLAVLILYLNFGEKNKIDWEEARRITYAKVRELQDENDLPQGHVDFLDDSFLQHIKTWKETNPFRWMVGFKIDGRSTLYYVMSISIYGEILALERRYEGWRVSDEPLFYDTGISGIFEQPKSKEDERVE